MKAIILAAGIGKRLRPMTNEMPKSLVPLMGRPIVTYTLDALSRTGVSEIIIVVGHCMDVLTEYLGEHHKGIPIRYVVNADYKTTNNIFSLKLALTHVDDDVILCEGDIAPAEDVLEVLCEQRNPNLVFVGRNEPHMSGSVVKLDTRSGRVRELIPKEKQRDDEDLGRLWKTANIYYFTRDFLRTSFIPMLDNYLSSHTINSYYEVILTVLLSQGNIRLQAHELNNSRWVEIDDEEDLKRAEKSFVPDRYTSIKNRHGGYWRHDFLDFSYLSNPYFPPPAFHAELKEKLPILLSNYPSGHDELCRMLSRWFDHENVSPEHLVVGNGAAELIRILITTIVKKITIPLPSFNEYENKLTKDQINGLKLSPADGYRLNADAFVRSVKQSGSNVGLIINPCNPTGTIVERQEIISILKQLDGVLLIVDESFIDFSGDRDLHSVQDLVAHYPSLVVIRSLSKEFGVPGLRLGYLLTSAPDLRQTILERIPIWNINSMGEYFIEKVPAYLGDYEASVHRCIADRSELFAGLQQISFLVPLPSFANFVLCSVIGRSAVDLSRTLFEEHNILIKECSNKRSLEKENVVRVAVKTREENQKLLNALKAME